MFQCYGGSSLTGLKLNRIWLDFDYALEFVWQTFYDMASFFDCRKGALMSVDIRVGSLAKSCRMSFPPTTI